LNLKAKKNCCRNCSSELNDVFVDLGHSPISNDYMEDLDAPEIFYPLKVYVCNKCWLVQTQDFKLANEIFREDYAYQSSTSISWLKHCKDYVDKIILERDITSKSFVVEVASNDGYLLENFHKKKIRCLGIEPTKSTAKLAIKKGINTEIAFFGYHKSKEIVETHGKADLLIGNNVFAHVPDINDFTKGMKNLLSKDGIITLEFPSLLSLIDGKKFDTIYHEHFSYLSALSVSNIFRKHGLKVFKIENLSTHGGSLRVYGCHTKNKIKLDKSVNEQLLNEKKRNLHSLEGYRNFQLHCEKIKNKFLKFLLNARKNKEKVIGFGAAAKGNTLLNFAGVKSDLISHVVDNASFKQGKFLPGSHLEILDPKKKNNLSCDIIIIFPWNIAPEIVEYLRSEVDIKSKIFTFIPEIKQW
tara:strand:+ start:2876 stop:4114 length:1239 start_codon:yes stop_codon:yes gene_type:complete